MLLNKPNILKKGQKISLIAPSSRITEEKMQLALQNISNFGYLTEIKHNFVEQTGYLSANDKKRLEYLHYFFKNKQDIGAIFCIRGGFGATRLLQNIDYDLIAKNPIIFVGFSDITVLQSAFFVKSKMPSLHGIVATSEFSEYTINQLNNLIVNPKENYILPHKTYTILNKGFAKGRIVGGNLSMLCSLIGTEYLFPFKNNIVFIEDIDEPPYKIDRMLTHLLQATDLKKASAIVFGSFNKCTAQDHNIEQEKSFTVEQIIEMNFSNLKIPVVFNLNFGHINESLLFPIGLNAVLETSNFKITLLEKLAK